MKICINGDLVDLSKIYCITKVDSRYISSRPIYDAINGEYNSDVKYCIEFYFTLVSINNKPHYIKIYREFILKNESDDFSHPDYIESIEFLNCINELNLFRDKIVEKWSKGQIDYEQFNIEVMIDVEEEGYEKAGDN